VKDGLHDLTTQKGGLNEIAKLTARRMGLLKAYLIRNYFRDQIENPMTPGLNPELDGAAYHCGRLLALYDGLQRAALGDVGAGVVQRFYAGATANPALIFARLAKLSMNHLDKLDGGLANWYEGQIAGVHDGIKGAYPGALTMEEQALFALGFWHQIAERNRQIAQGKANRAEAKNAAGSKTTDENP
jgi:CRISPR-associated protein Csd1